MANNAMEMLSQLTETISHLSEVIKYLNDFVLETRNNNRKIITELEKVSVQYELLDERIDKISNG